MSVLTGIFIIIMGGMGIGLIAVVLDSPFMKVLASRLQKKDNKDTLKLEEKIGRLESQLLTAQDDIDKLQEHQRFLDNLLEDKTHR